MPYPPLSELAPPYPLLPPLRRRSYDLPDLPPPEDAGQRFRGCLAEQRYLTLSVFLVTALLVCYFLIHFVNDYLTEG